MSRLDVRALISEAGLEDDHIERDHFGKPTSLPYAVYIYGKTVSLCADDAILVKNQEIIIELYTDCERDPALMDMICAVLERHGIIYETAEDYIESEDMYRVSFYFEEMI